MISRLRSILLSVPVVTAVALMALYLALGFLALPAIVKWQAEKQVRETPGHQLSISKIRFNPLLFEFEVNDLALTGAQGQPMLGWRRLFVDFELWRSVVGGAWTFAAATLEAPTLDLEFLPDGQHNFSALLQRLSADDRSDSPPAADLPRLAVKHLALSDGRIDISDRLLAEPRVTRIEPLAFEVTALSTLAGPPASFRVTARTALGETLDTTGELRLNPVAAKGQLQVGGIEVATLVKAASRFVAIDAPAGRIEATGKFDLGIDRDGRLAGTATDLALGIDALSISAVGGRSPLLTLERVSLAGGHVDLGQREAAFASARLANGRIEASTDPQGLLDWATLVRAVAEPPSTGAAAAVTPSLPDATATAPAKDGWRVSIARAEAAALAIGLADAAQGRSAQIAAVALNGSPSAEFGASGLTVRFDKPALALTAVRLVQREDFLAVADLRLESTQWSLASAATGLEARLEAPRITARQGLSAQQGQDKFSVGGASLDLGGLSMRQGGGDVGGTIGANVDASRLVLSGISMKRPGEVTTLGDLSVEGKTLTLKATPGKVRIDLEAWRSALAHLQGSRGNDRLDLGKASLSIGKGSLDQDNRGLRVALDAAQLSSERASATLGKAHGTIASMAMAGASAALQVPQATPPDVTAQRGKAGVDPRHAVLAVPSTTPARAAGATSGLQASVDGATLRLGSLAFAARGARSDLARLARATVTAKALRLTQPGGSVDLAGDGVGAELSSAVLRSPHDDAEVLHLGRAALAGGRLRLGERKFSADKVSLAQGDAMTWLDDQGRFNLSSLFGDAAPADASAAVVRPAPPAAKAATGPPWRISVRLAQLDEFAMGFEDRREAPPFALRLEQIRARASALDTASPDPMQLDAQARLASGGNLQAAGRIHADSGALDLNIGLDGIALAPLQAYLSKFAKLQIASGTLSSSGRLQQGGDTGGAQLAYNGKLSVDRLLLEEVEPKRPFLSWDAVATDDLLLSLSPNRVDIGELRLDQPAGRLIIAADQSVNLSDVIRKPKVDAGPKPSPAPRTQAEPAPQFHVSVARLRVSDGALEFADLSLRPQFAAKMHELKGVVTGLGNDPNGSAKLQLDARVDRYGSAKISGQVSVLRPEQLTEIDMAFRNLELTSLSPYVAKFAGYRIASGQLALDLQYKVLDRKLVGENKVVLNQLVLGEKVQSPDALNLPLELAVALLKDSKGVIDIGLPVSGDLADPKFDYGAVIGKAIGNLLSGIVTAPFRALGALFGGGDQALDEIHFEAGSDVLAPPERQKLAAVAKALNERPALSLVVPPTFTPARDTPVLQSLAVHRDIIERMGIKLAAGEQPGPIDVANARSQHAIESAFGMRYAPEVLAMLKRRATEAPAPAAGAATAASVPRPPRPGQPAQLPSDFYQGLVDRMIADQAVTDEQLSQLALRRGQAVQDELTVAGGVAAARIALGQPRPATGAKDKTVTLRLELKAAP